MFDKSNNQVFLTGGTYARGFFVPEASSYELQQQMNSDCFFVAISLPNNATEVAQWEQPTRLGYVRDPEACSTAHYIENNERIYLGASASGASIGTTDIEGDILPQQKDVSLFGEVISVSLDHLYKRAPVLPQHYLFGGHGFFQSEVSYPFAITSAPRPMNATDEEFVAAEEPIYVASLYSKYIGQWAEDIEEEEVDLSNPYLNGNVWGISIQKINTNPSDAIDRASILNNPTHMSRAWKKNLETTYFQKLQAADMIYVNDRLLLAGSTYDFGFEFAGSDRNNQTFQDFDGFLVKFDPATGSVPQSGQGEKMMKRIQTEGETDDIIHGMCLHPAKPDGTVDFVYVVGASAPKNEDFESVIPNATSPRIVGGTAFVQMVDLFSMETIWEAKIDKPTAEATDCAVSEDGATLYVAGNIGEGWSLPTEESKGGSDVWIRKYNLDNVQQSTTDQIFEWERQLGSEKDDSLAKGGALIIDNNSNVILYGNTRGSVGRVRSETLDRPDETNDVFILTVGHDGEYLAPSPEPVFQIAERYFGQKPHRHRVLIFIMTVIMIVLFFTTVGSEMKLTTVGQIYNNHLDGVFFASKDERERMTGSKASDLRSGTSLADSQTSRYSDDPRRPERIFV